MRRCKTCHKRIPKDSPTRQEYCTTECADRARKIRNKYGLYADDVYAMYKEQNGRCGICGDPGDVRELGFIKRKTLCIDHDHKTGAIRSLLCSGCNLGIGKLRDDIDIVHRALKYLKKHKRNPRGKRKVRGPSRRERVRH